MFLFLAFCTFCEEFNCCYHLEILFLILLHLFQQFHLQGKYQLFRKEQLYTNSKVFPTYRQVYLFFSTYHFCVSRWQIGKNVDIFLQTHSELWNTFTTCFNIMSYSYFLLYYYNSFPYSYWSISLSGFFCCHT